MKIDKIIFYIKNIFKKDITKSNEGDKNKMEITYLKNLYAQYGVPWDEANIFGIRHEEDQQLDVFNDFIGIATDTEIKLFPGTVDPGKPWTLNPVTVEGITGAAHLCLGQHKNAWMIGIHAPNTNFAHEGLIQIGNAVSVWRDVNRDGFFEQGEPITKGYYGINIHRAYPPGSGATPLVGPYSAGCQVFQVAEDLGYVLNILKATNKYKKDPKCLWSYMLFHKNAIQI